MTRARISYLAREDSTPEKESGVLATIYKLVLDSANRNAASVTSTNGNDAERDLSDSASNDSTT
jgi:hypothetical protein